MDNLMEQINKLSLPATILIVTVILGGFYFAVEYNKQRFIEKQQQQEKLDRSSCWVEAETYALKRYKETCTYDCKEGYYYEMDRDHYFTTCLIRKGLPIKP
jgi:hypothetical protein